MRRPVAAVGSSVFFVIAPGVGAGLIPWWLTRWQVRQTAYLWGPVRLAAAVLVIAAVAVLVTAFLRFIVEGRGTPAPIAPTENLVIGGLYRYVRNPMYVAVLAAIVGQAIALWQFALLWYAAAVCVAFVTFVKLYEEPTLARRFGAQYEEYRRTVRPWRPRWPK